MTFKYRNKWLSFYGSGDAFFVRIDGIDQDLPPLPLGFAITEAITLIDRDLVSKRPSSYATPEEAAAREEAELDDLVRELNS